MVCEDRDNIKGTVSIYNLSTLKEAGCYKIKELDDVFIEKLDDLSELDKRGLCTIEDEENVVRTNLPQALKEKGLITSDLSRLTGISRQYINAVIRQNIKPGIDFALKTSYVLGIPVEQLFTLTENAWIKPCKIGNDISVYVDVIHAIILDNRVLKMLLKVNPMLYLNQETGQKLTKTEYESSLRKYILDKVDERKEELKSQHPDMSSKTITSLAIDSLKKEFMAKHSKIYKKLGEKITPYVLR